MTGAPIDTTEDLSTDPYSMVIDVRSPSEYAEDHIPDALNVPVLSDEERAQVGTIYTKESPFKARKIGAALVSRNIARALEGPLKDQMSDFHPLIYCWRGGQRSASLATVLSQIGWRCTLLTGGYKSYRRHVVAALDDLPPRFDFICLSGLTGTGKTRLLRLMATRGFQVLDLEALADHRGSLLGAEPDRSQPSQKTFETRLWQALSRFDGTRPVWVESESSKIGNLNCPSGLWRSIGSARSVQIDVPLDARISLLMEDYAFHMDDTATLLNAVTQLTSLHGKEKIGQWRELIEEKKWQTFVSDLLRTHYDPAYERALKRHDRLVGPSHELTDLSQASFDDLMDRFVSTYGL